ncbi:MAG TPA: hypothetical protein VJY41_13805 [Prolixibacteraceae bacterium]|nr:hypothetical protein [Prolixibacteraceae bacterium]
MEQPILHRVFSAFFILIVLSMLPSCVAKKKFVAMTGSRDRAELRVRELTTTVGRYETDYNLAKTDFHYNNSMKNNTIDSLGKVILNLNTDMASHSENIGDQVLSFQVEKRRLNQLLVEKDQEIRSLKQSIDLTKQQLNDQSQSVQDLNIKLRNAESELKSIKSEVEIMKDDGAKLNTSMAGKNNEINKLNAKIKEKNEQVEALQNQVNLLKKQFGQ